jgi:thymidine kinase
MNAGKSTVMLQSGYNYNERGMDTLLFVPKFDTRYGEGKVTSRIGIEARAIAFGIDFNLYEFVAGEIKKNNNIKCVLLDEAQFLTKHQVLQLLQITDDFNVPVLTYGLRTDFLGEPFEGSAYLLALADNIVEIKTICHCGKKATMNLRVDANGNAVKEGAQIEIGGNDRYLAVCRKHHRSAMAEIEKNKK